MPRSDMVVLEVASRSTSRPLRSLPLSPFPVSSGTPILSHLFSAPGQPLVHRSKRRTTELGAEYNFDIQTLEEPIRWLDGNGWRRWGCGHMLGYRSYTGQELEAGTSAVLPHILTSVLPTRGSSGGPLVHAETGSVVGMISSRRRDYQVEGERGWGSSSEIIYEVCYQTNRSVMQMLILFQMFSLPGFMPTNQ